MQKNIFIVTQGGLDARYGQWAAEAAAEFMEMFPEYQEDYPVKISATGVVRTNLQVTRTICVLPKICVLFIFRPPAEIF